MPSQLRTPLPAETHEQRGALLEELGGIGSAQGSTWKGLGKKMAKLMPFLWPRKQPGLQLRVLACFATLVAGRVINLFVPLYYKYIGDAFSFTLGMIACNLSIYSECAVGARILLGSHSHLRRSSIHAG